MLLASYLHDIGMSPYRETYSAHRSFLLTGGPATLSEEERNELQAWLDDNRGGVVPPVVGAEPDEAALFEAEQLLAYYCRARHNDWSEKWIRENLVDLKNPLYHGWIDDLITLCKSHHEDLLDLKSDRYDARLIGVKGEVLNLRYLAALLRVADVLEFDPERTPEVIMKHRDIAPASKVYWQKDHSIGFTLVKDQHDILITARTPDAPVHRAVLETIRWVNQELHTCATLHGEGLFKTGNIPQRDRERYAWDWPLQVRQDVREKPGTFTYIDGGFRPDKVKILQLLSGTNLYGDRWAAVRELVQNAVDAVREQIARERLLKPDPADQKWENLLGQSHSISLRFQHDGEKYYLLCSDDGVGMDRKVIEDHLLVSGSRQRGELAALERAANRKGFSVGKTGQFGIGLLSYFMMAQKIVISTRRSPLVGAGDACGWQFAIDGLDSFGELRRHNRAAHGTEVQLELAEGILLGGPREFAYRLSKYVANVLRFSPCHVEVVDEVTGLEKVQLPAGWTATEATMLAATGVVVPSPAGGMGDIDTAPAAEKARYRSWEEDVAALTSGVDACARVYGPRVFQLGENGAGRLWLPYVQLEGGASLLYLDIEDGVVRSRCDATNVFSLSRSEGTSWRGFSVGSSVRIPDGLHYELNIVEGAEISVDRRGLIRDENVGLTGEIVLSESRALLDAFLKENEASKYSLLNLRAAKRLGVHQPWADYGWSASWAVRSGGQTLFKDIEFPCIDLAMPKHVRPVDQVLRSWDHEELEVLAPLWTGNYDNFRLSSLVPTGRLTFLALSHVLVPAFEWSNVDEMRSNGGKPDCCSFPEGWDNVAFIGAYGRNVYNSKNSLVADLDLIDHSWFRRSPRSMAEAARTISNRLDARAFLLANMSNTERIWSGFVDNFPDEYRSVVDCAKLQDDGISWWHVHSTFDDDITFTLRNTGLSTRLGASTKGGGLLELPDRSLLCIGEQRIEMARDTEH